MKIKDTALGLPLLALLVGVGCGSEPEEEGSNSPGATDPEVTETPAEPTTPPTPTELPPTPTPVPTFDAHYRTSIWHVEEGQGFDQDGDGSIDNAFYDMFAVVQTVAYDTTYDAAQASLADEVAAGDLTQAQADVIATTAATGVAAVFTADSFNLAMDTLIASGALNFIETVTGTRADLDFTWYSAVAGATQPYTVDKNLGTQSGEMDGAGVCEVGPADLTYNFGKITPTNEEDAILVIKNSSSEFTYTASALANGMVGGVIYEADLIEFLDALYPDAYGESIPGQEPIPTNNDEFLAQVSAALDQASLFDLEAGAAMSVAFTFESTQAAVTLPSARD